MLQKIVVVIVGLVMSVVGALTPDALFASNEGSGDSLSADTTEEMLSTVRASDGQAFARISVLWVEVDGRRVTEDAWGTGEVDEMRFKVGVKGVEDAALAVGDKVVDLHPTDIITVRMFRGDFSYRGVGTALATVQLQGTVKTTVLKEGDITNRVMTAPGELDLNGVGQRNAAGDASDVAYVVLTTGEKVDTVAVEDGGARLFTQEATAASEATTEAGNLLAKWVKIDNKLVREYTWGDGVIRKIEFEPAEAATRSIVLTYNDEVAEVAAGERVVIEDFVGEYLIYQVSGGMLRVRLDGYSATLQMGSKIDTPQIGGAGAPAVDFRWTPLSPKTTDTVRFTAEERDEGGLIVFRQWDFGDDTSSVALEQPTHRFAAPGVYEVTLSVTDNDLQTSNVTHTIVVRNAEPVPDFDFSPKIVTTRSMVAFSDLSFDNDGNITSYEWDFGDGATDTHRNPSHNYTAGDTYTVTLTTTDDLGARSSISKVLVVRNAPPMASFAFSTVNDTPPMTLEPIHFLDTSTDTDGVLARWNWSFGDGSFGSGSAPTHQYHAPGVYTVRLTAFDDKDDADTASTNIIVHNRPPFADFVWAPGIESPANIPVTFTSTSVDPDGVVLLHVWDFGDGTKDVRGGTVTHTFPRAGTYNVRLTVTDNTLGTSNVTKSVNVSNSAPHANFRVSANPAYRATELVFSDASTDPDGDSIVNWTWELGDGSSAYGKVIRYSYATTGTKVVNLTVRDSAGVDATVSRPVRVLNRPPTILASYTPLAPVAGQDVTFMAEGLDPDVPGGLVTFQWGFSDGNVSTGQTVVRSFPKAGNYSVVVHGRDEDGGVSAPSILMIRVDHARPQVNFSFSPDIPIRGAPVAFTANVTPAPDADITGYRWDFGFDATSTASTPNATFIYARNGTFLVTLEVIDEFGMVNSTTKELFVNIAPSARFGVPPGGIRLGVPFTLTDLSFDEDGEIVSWFWEFGDATNRSGQDPGEHTFLSSGAYVVNLTVTDDKGATSRDSKVLEIANRPPLADWTFSAEPQERGVRFDFDGTSSSDPDGQGIVSYSWDFGDNSDDATGPLVNHTFGTSGFTTVGLVVQDAGGRVSARTPDSHQRIRIGANHDVLVHVTAVLPGPRDADLSQSHYTITARLGTVPIPGDNIQVNGTGYDIIVPKALWLNGFDLTVRLAAPFLAQTERFEEQTVKLLDDDRELNILFELELRRTPVIVPDGGVNNFTVADLIDLSELLLGSGNRTTSGDPIYRDMRERAHGTGFLLYSDGTPAPREKVYIHARYVPLKQLVPLRDTQQVAAIVDGPLLGWCIVGETETALDGTFAWQFDGTTTCVTNHVASGLYPVGRWEVRAVADSDLSNPSPPRAVYYDPTGGIILNAMLGLA